MAKAQPDSPEQLPSEHASAPPPVAYGSPWYRDRNLVSTAALAIISLCAVFVSVYQAVILGQQQRVMAEQQAIMMESARAQLWPRLEVGFNRSYNRDGEPTQFELVVENSGTGPAIVEGVGMTYDGQPIRDYEDLFFAAGMSDTMYTARSNAQLSGTVVQAGEQRMVMGLTVNSPLMRAFVSALRDGGAWEMQVCYRSVFGDRFVTTPDLINAVPGNTVPVDSCVLVGAGAFGQ